MKTEILEPKTDASEINPRVVSESEWLVARKDLLTREKELTRLRDEELVPLEVFGRRKRFHHGSRWLVREGTERRRRVVEVQDPIRVVPA